MTVAGLLFTFMISAPMARAHPSRPLQFPDQPASSVFFNEGLILLKPEQIKLVRALAQSANRFLSYEQVAHEMSWGDLLRMRRAQDLADEINFEAKFATGETLIDFVLDRGLRLRLDFSDKTMNEQSALEILRQRVKDGRLDISSELSWVLPFSFLQLVELTRILNKERQLNGESEIREVRVVLWHYQLITATGFNDTGQGVARIDRLPAPGTQTLRCELGLARE